jgi:hypothetical protein
MTRLPRVAPPRANPPAPAAAMSAPGFVTPGLPLGGFQTAVLAPRAPRPARAAAAARRPAPHMVATAAPSGAALSGRAEELLSWVRAHKSIFSPGAGFTATHLALYRKNDTARCMVPADELDCNADMLPGVEVARVMLEKADATFEAAKAAVLKVAPELATEDAMAKIFWHDLRYYARVASYGIGCGSTDYLHANNLGMVRELYREIGLSGQAVQTGIATLKATVLEDVSDPAMASLVADCFDVLADSMAE